MPFSNERFWKYFRYSAFHWLDSLRLTFVSFPIYMLHYNYWHLSMLHYDVKLLTFVHVTLWCEITGRYTCYIMMWNYWQIYMLHYDVKLLAFVHITWWCEVTDICPCYIMMWNYWHLSMLHYDVKLLTFVHVTLWLYSLKINFIWNHIPGGGGGSGEGCNFLGTNLLLSFLKIINNKEYA